VRIWDGEDLCRGAAPWIDTGSEVVCEIHPEWDGRSGAIGQAWADKAAAGISRISPHSVLGAGLQQGGIP